VGRQYQAVHYQPTAIIVVNSVIDCRELRDQVRAIWTSENPRKKLFDSLLMDYATENKFQGSFREYGDGNLQVQAALRLLYYFPKETASLIAQRLKSLDVRDSPIDYSIKRDTANGVRTSEFIKAVAWCQEPAIQQALDDIAKRTDDPEIKKALEGRDPEGR
jgi:hypothetical protein